MQQASKPRAILAGPAMESLLAGSKKSLWPREILNDPGVTRETLTRQTLLATVKAIFEKIPDPTTEIADAVAAKAVFAEEAARLYGLLADFFNANPYHARLVLYFPFELIPPKDWQPDSTGLQAAAAKFMSAYMRDWRGLLDEADVRANFVDGNILEPELAPDGQALVRKAAHLLPMLAKRGHVSAEEAIRLLDQSSDSMLKDSIADALPALAPLGLMSKRNCEEALNIRGYNMPEAKSSGREKDAAFNRDWFLKLPGEIEAEIKKLDMREALDHSRGLPPARVAWERKNGQDLLVSDYASRIASAIAEIGTIPPEASEPKALSLAIMRGMGLAIERLANADRARAEALAGSALSRARINSNEDDIRDEFESVLSRAASLGIIEEGALRKNGFSLPKLDATFSIAGQLGEEIAGFEKVVMSIGLDAEASALLYPAAAFFGSRLKGYARRDADLDVAVFVRPGIPESERGSIRRIVARLFPDKKVGGKAVEFWLAEDGDMLRVRDFERADVLVADSTWAHLLLSSVWLGQEEVLRELYAKLLPGFLQAGGRKFMDRDIRTLWLDELEREVLQYRLMHKGYRRFFPPQGGIEALNAPDLDPESAFWDSGYRRLALKLFVSRVFLPQMQAKK